MVVLGGCGILAPDRGPCHPSLIYSTKADDNFSSPPLAAEDGPYVMERDGRHESFHVVECDGRFVISRRDLSDRDLDELSTTVANSNKTEFRFGIRGTYIRDDDAYELPDKLIAVSDIEGRFTALYSFLLANSVIDQQLNWVFDTGHLVFVGDLMDRGENVTQVMWLVYKLEQEAEIAGGKVHVLLGNHEVMNLNADIRYVDSKYISLATRLGPNVGPTDAYRALFSTDNELVKWLLSKNLVTKIGPYLFVHAGLSADLAATGLSIHDINRLGAEALRQQAFDRRNDDANVALVAGGSGPLWYRGLVKRKSAYDKASAEDVRKILEAYDASAIVIGHSIVDDISTDYAGRVIRIDVDHKDEMATGRTRGLLIENGEVFGVDDLGSRREVEEIGVSILEAEVDGR